MNWHQSHPPYQKDSSQEDLIKTYQKTDSPPLLLCLASPGTGKTTTISRIIQAIVAQQDPPNPHLNFLTLTFTKKTRKDLIAKLKSSPDNQCSKDELLSRVKNFHSLAYSLLKWQGNIEESECKAFLREVIGLNDMGEGGKFGEQLLDEVWRVTQKMLWQGKTVQEWKQAIETQFTSPKNYKVGHILKNYLEWLEESIEIRRKITYDYSLVKAAQAIREGGSIHKIDLDSISLVIVDEFQDTNPAQMKMVEAILQRSKQAKLLMVGDFDQNIYEWRGTDLTYLSQYASKRKPVIKFLENSYRMGHAVTTLSQKMITSSQYYNFFRNRFYSNYTLNARNPKNAEPEVRTFKSEVSEVRWVVDQIEQHMSEGVKLKGMAVLLRWFANNSFYKRLQAEIRRRRQIGGHPQIQYDIKFHNSTLSSKSVTYIMAILGYFVARRSNLHPQTLQDCITRIVEPIRHIGVKDEAYLRILEKQELVEQHVYYTEMSDASGQRSAAWKQFFVDFKQISGIVNNQTEIGFEKVCKKIVGVLKSAAWGEVQLKTNVLQDFYVAIQDIIGDQQQNTSIQVAPLDFFHLTRVYGDLFYLSQPQFSQHKDLYEGIDRPKPNRLQIQTIHDAKGLEYEVVFICSLNYAFTYFPPKPNRYRDKEIDKLESSFSEVNKQIQQLRVIYTALTRTSHYSYISCSRKDCVVPWWVRKNRKDHEQLVFLRQNAKDMGVVPFNEILDQPVLDHFEYEMLNSGMGNMSV